MANIQSNLNKIKNAVLGIEVRDSIHDAIKQCYDDASAKDNANMEVKMARGEYENLGKRLDSHSSQIKEKMNKDDYISISQIDKNKGKIDESYLSDELLQQIAGDAPIGTVPADGSITNKKLADLSVDENKVNRIIANKKINYKIFNIESGRHLNDIAISQVTGNQSLSVKDNELVWNIGAESSYTYVCFDIDIRTLKEDGFINEGDTLSIGIGQYRTGLKTSNIKIKIQQYSIGNVKLEETLYYLEDIRNNMISYNDIILNNNTAKIRVFLDIGGINESLEIHFTSLCIVNSSFDLLDVVDCRNLKLIEKLKDNSIKNRTNPIKFTSTENTIFTLNENTNELNIKVGETADNSAWFIDYDLSSFKNGEQVEVFLKYKTSLSTNSSYRVKARLDLQTDDFFQLNASGNYETYRKIYTVGDEVKNKIRILGIYGTPNTDDYLAQAYVRKYNEDTYRYDLVREKIYDYVKEEEKKENIILNGKTNVIEVNCNYSDAEDGLGVTKFKDLISAHRSITDASITNKYIIKVHPGTYKEWEREWNGSDGECDWGPYKGIVIKNYVYFESTDIEHPENYILEWDGHVGYTGTMTTAQAMEKAIFHISRNGTNTHIKGFTIRSKNTRYCVHPESAGNGKGANWLIENCIFDWNGRPDVDNTLGGHPIGIGISAEETGTIKNCKILKNGDWSGNISGHNNGYNVINNGDKDFITHGAKLIIEDCVFQNGNIIQYSEKDEIDTVDSLVVKRCSGINEIQIGEPKSGVRNTWTVNIENSEYAVLSIPN